MIILTMMVSGRGRWGGGEFCLGHIDSWAVLGFPGLGGLSSRQLAILPVCSSEKED